jgi:hypothetical protein
LGGMMAGFGLHDRGEALHCPGEDIPRFFESPLWKRTSRRAVATAPPARAVPVEIASAFMAISP